MVSQRRVCSECVGGLSGQCGGLSVDMSSTGLHHEAGALENIPDCKYTTVTLENINELDFFFFF